MTDIRDIQVAVAKAGFNPGPLDGKNGTHTAGGFEDLLEKELGLFFSVRPSGGSFVLTPVPSSVRVTPPAQAPTPTPAKPNVPATQETTSPPWLDVAFKMMGLHETRDNAKLREFLRSDGGTVGDPSVYPWCADFVHTAIRLALRKEEFTGPVKENPYLARNWIDYGKMLHEGCRGAILSFHNGDPRSIYGHLGLYWGEDTDFFYVLGGNQSNSVSITKIRKSRLRLGGIRWPLSAASGPGRAVQITDAKLAASIKEVESTR